MTEAFTKLFNSIITSSIWSEDDKTRLMWITFLASSDANGFVTGSIPGMAAIARMSLKDAEKSIKALTKPDPYSRSKEYEGRRLLETEGGWLIANYTKYRQKRDPEIRRKQNREAQRRFKSKQKVSQSKPQSAQAEAEADKEKEIYKEKEKPVCIDKTKVDNKSLSRISAEPKAKNNTKSRAVSPTEFMDYWNAHETLPPIRTFTSGRKRALATRCKEPMFVENWRQIINKLSQSLWHTGRDPKGNGWQATVDWLLKKETNYVKILELAEPEFGSRKVTEEEAEELMKEIRKYENE